MKQFATRFEQAFATLASPVIYGAAYYEIARGNFLMALGNVGTFALLWFMFGPAARR